MKKIIFSFFHFFILSFFSMLFLLGCADQTNIKQTIQAITKFSCSAEKTDGKYFLEEEIKFLNGNSHSVEESFTGNFSSKINKDKPFGLGLEVTNLSWNEIVIAKIYRKGSGVLAVKTSWGLWQSIGEGPKQKDSAWQKLVLKIYVPDTVQNGSLTVFAHNMNKTPGYFDDLVVARVPEDSIYKSVTGLSTLNLNISDLDYQRIDKKRKESLKNGILLDSNKVIVHGKLTFGNKELDINLRLKGDQSDHFSTMKWSFRIECLGREQWNNMQAFSLHDPKTRGDLMEWTFHKILEKQGILTPRYGFINLSFNNKNLGIYAFEEHFSVDFLNDRNLAISPILRFDENKMWETRNANNGKDGNFPVFENAEITCYNQKDFETQKELIPLFQRGKELMNHYKNGTKKAEEIFNTEKLTEYFAILDHTKAYHAIIWHNQRFYYNPKIDKLEPVGYDGYGANGIYNWVKYPTLGDTIFKIAQPTTLLKNMYKNVFSDNEFVQKYYYYQKNNIAVSFTDELNKKLNTEYNKLEQLLNDEISQIEF